MSDVSVIGLGSMGAALAHSLLRGNNTVSVWNRTPARMEPLIDAGAIRTSSVAEVIRASPVMLVCIDNYMITKDLIGTAEVASHLDGRIIIQLSTGTPKEARDFATSMEAFGAQCIDGAIIGGPENLHTNSAEVLFAGSESVFAAVESLVQSLCSNIRYVGEDIGAAAALDLAWLCQQYGIIMGVIQGAFLCESEGISVDLLSRTYRKSDAAWSPVLATTIHKSEFADPGASLRIWGSVAKIIGRQADDAGVRNEFLEFMAGVIDRGIAAGYGEEDAAALIKVLRLP